MFVNLFCVLCLQKSFDNDFSKSDLWDGNAKNTNWSGNGSFNSPYLIQSAGDLAGLQQQVSKSNNYNEKFFLLTVDIDLNHFSWNPIGNSIDHFQGNFDGNNHVIGNLNITQLSDFSGLFGYLQNSNIFNLTVKCDLKNFGKYNGAISGYMINVTLINVHVIGNIEGLEFTGGFAGFCDCVSMKNVYFEGKINGRNNTGGLAGSITNCEFSDCVVDGTIVGSGNVDGVSGSSFNQCKIVNISLPCAVEKSKTEQPEWPKSPVKDFVYSISGQHVTITGYTGAGGNVVVPDIIGFNPVVYIGNNAFSGKQNISSIVLPNSILNIGYEAFKNCRNLIDIKLSNKLEYIGYKIFEGCSNLREIVIPKSLQRNDQPKYGNDAYSFIYSSIEKVEFEEGTTDIITNLFCKVNTLKEIIFPTSLTKIGSYSFNGCSSLTKVTLPNKLKSIGSYAFSSTGIKTITLPDSVNDVESFAFSSTKLETIIFSNKMRTIKNNLFNNCLQLESLIIPDNILNIEPESFKNCRNLYNITLPNKLEYIGYKIFEGCSNLREIVIPKSLQRNDQPKYGNDAYSFIYSSIEKVKFEEGTTDIITNLFCKVNTLKEIIFPKSLLHIGSYSFNGCSSLTKVTLPNKLRRIGSYAFSSTGIKTITLPNSVNDVESFAFSSTKLETIIFSNKMRTIKNNLFNKCLQLESLIIPDNILNIEPESFKNCRNLIDIKLSNKLEYIGYKIFEGCSNLREIVIPKSLQRNDQPKYGNDAYSFIYSSIEKVEFEEGTTDIITNLFCKVNTLKEIIFPTSLLNIGPYSFNGCSSLTKVTLPNKLRRIGSYAFSSTGIKTITLPDSVNDVESFAFSSTKLETIIFSNKMRTIKNNLFNNCLQLESLIIPDNILNIEPESFKNCRNLYNITLPNRLEYIGYKIFEGCSNLREIVIPKSLQRNDQPKYGNDAYSFIYSSIEKVEFEEGTTDIITNLFCKVNTLKEIIFPTSLTKIGPYSFNGCSSLTTVTIPENVKNIDQNSFQNCPSLVFQVISGSYAEKYAKSHNIKIIYIDNYKTKLKPVTASIQPSSCIFNGTLVELYSSTPNSVIYFKTNNSQDYQNFNKPIVIVKDTIITTYAEHNDYLNSDVVSYSYILCKSYTISFDSNGGNEISSSKVVTNNKKYGELPIPTRINHTFDGWYIDLNSDIRITEETIVNISHDAILHAKWIKNKIESSLEKNDKDVHTDQITTEINNEAQTKKNELIINDSVDVCQPYGKEFIKGFISGSLLAFMTSFIIFRNKNNSKKKHNSDQGQ